MNNEENTKQTLKLAAELVGEAVDEGNMLAAQAAQAYVLIVIACELRNIVKELKDDN